MNKPLPACLTAALRGQTFPSPLYLALMTDELITIRNKDPQSGWQRRHPFYGRMRAYARTWRMTYSPRYNAKCDLWVLGHVCLNPRPRQRMI